MGIKKNSVGALMSAGLSSFAFRSRFNWSLIGSIAGIVTLSYIAMNAAIEFNSDLNKINIIKDELLIVLSVCPYYVMSDMHNIVKGLPPECFQYIGILHECYGLSLYDSMRIVFDCFSKEVEIPGVTGGEWKSLFEIFDKEKFGSDDNIRDFVQIYKDKCHDRIYCPDGLDRIIDSAETLSREIPKAPSNKIYIPERS